MPKRPNSRAKNKNDLEPSSCAGNKKAKAGPASVKVQAEKVDASIQTVQVPDKPDVLAFRQGPIPTSPQVALAPASAQVPPTFAPPQYLLPHYSFAQYQQQPFNFEAVFQPIAPVVQAPAQPTSQCGSAAATWPLVPAWSPACSATSSCLPCHPPPPLLPINPAPAWCKLWICSSSAK